MIFTTAHAFLLFFSNRGKVYRVRAMDIPERERTAKGMPIVNLLPLQAGETIQAIIDTRDFAGERNLFFATKKGVVKKTAFHEYDTSRRDGLIAINLRDDDELVRVIETSGTDDIFMVGRSGMTIRFSETEVRAMGRTAGGVRGMKLRAGDEVVSVDVARDDTAILMITEAGYGKRTQLEHFNRQGRGGQGVIGIKLTNRKGKVVAAFMVAPRGRDRRHLQRRRHHPDGCARDQLAGSRRHRRQGDEPRRRPDRRLGRADPRRRGLTDRQITRPDGPPRVLGAACPRDSEEAPMRTARTTDPGQATLLMVAVVACCGLTAVAVGTLGGALVDRQQAQTAADAAALAGVDGGARGGSGSGAVERRPRSSRTRALSGRTAEDERSSVTVSVGATTARARAIERPVERADESAEPPAPDRARFSMLIGVASDKPGG